MADESKVVSFSERRAAKLVESGLDKVNVGDLDQATADFLASIDCHPTAEAYTYYGWMLSKKGDFDGAIEQCHKAIAVDPSFGNPYNDIGSYLTIQGRVDEAIPWFERAMLATRYEPRHFPHMNLGRIYITKNLLKAAREQFRKALAYAPDNRQLRLVIQQLDEQLN
ncbi:MAG: tetratricopeptide repeat protein [Myxococcales bacterium]|nr:tetratricopeptide repeat protein [Myxococcales bacterium]